MNPAYTRRNFLKTSLWLPAITAGMRLRASDSNVVDTTIEASERWVVIGERSARLYAYNGNVPGPVLEAHAGDTLRVFFQNNLSEETNLHFHGLHVPPVGNADNPFIMVAPGESFQYELPIPANHPGGTFWMHPHVHGKTARQVSRGLAMPLLIRGDLDQIPAIVAASESVLVLQDFDLDEAGYSVEPNTLARMQGREGSLITAGGAVNPTIPLKAGGWVRLHLVNASSSRFYLLQMEGHPLIQIASDGGGLPSPRPANQLLLAPGERCQVMIQGTAASGSYRLLNLPYVRGVMGMMGGFGPPSLTSTVLATLVYQGREDSPVALDQTLIPVTPLPPAAITRTFMLGQGMGMFGRAAMFTVNNRTFDPSRVDTKVSLGDVEDWEFVNISMMDHPMHIHTNPFQVIGPDGRPDTAWKDVAVVRAGSRLRIRTHFLDYAGTTVYHCHILDHEDLGMMGVLQIAS